MKTRPVIRENASEMVLTVLIWAIISLLGIRLYLEITNYPILGGGIWHISHVLAGGITMAIGAMINFCLHGQKTKKTAAAIFGVGFGWFIDEIGKFVTSDYNYFFQPAFSFIYVFFILLFLLYRYFEKYIPKDPRAALFQVIGQLEDAAEGGLSPKEKTRALSKLDLVVKMGEEGDREMAKQLKLVIKKAQGENEVVGRNMMRWQWIKSFAYKIFKKKAVLYILEIVAIGYVVGGVTGFYFLVSRFRPNEFYRLWNGGINLLTNTDMVMFGLKTGADLLASGWLLAGLYWVTKRKPKKGINFFQYGLLINIFLSSVFQFYFEQLNGVAGVIGSVIIYSGLARLKKEMV